MAQKVLIYERDSGQFVEAVFHENVTPEELAQAESEWKPLRQQAFEQLLAEGKSELEARKILQHAHWDWGGKAKGLLSRALAIRCFGLERDGQWQGLAMLDLAAHCALLAPDQGKPLVCIEFLEVAPWNIREMVDAPRYGIVGTRLVEAAVRLSIAEGFHGRVGLLALPQAEWFYEQRCGMLRVEGGGRFGMGWYEMNRGGAEQFLEGGG